MSTRSTTLETLKVVTVIGAAMLLVYALSAMGADLFTSLIGLVVVCLALLVLAFVAKAAIRYWPLTLIIVILVVATNRWAESAERVTCWPVSAGIKHCRITDSRGYEVSRVSCRKLKNGTTVCNKVW